MYLYNPKILNMKSKRNLIRQIIKLKDGSTKSIFHKKQFANGSFRETWLSWNRTKVGERF